MSPPRHTLTRVTFRAFRVVEADHKAASSHLYNVAFTPELSLPAAETLIHA